MDQNEFDDNLKKLLNVPPPNKDKRHKKMPTEELELIMNQLTAALAEGKDWIFSGDNVKYSFTKTPISMVEWTENGGNPFPPHHYLYVVFRSIITKGESQKQRQAYIVSAEEGKIYLQINNQKCELKTFDFSNDFSSGTIYLESPLDGKVTLIKAVSP